MEIFRVTQFLPVLGPPETGLFFKVTIEDRIRHNKHLIAAITEYLNLQKEGMAYEEVSLLGKVTIALQDEVVAMLDKRYEEKNGDDDKNTTGHDA